MPTWTALRLLDIIAEHFLVQDFAAMDLDKINALRSNKEYSEIHCRYITVSPATRRFTLHLELGMDGRNTKKD